MAVDALRKSTGSRITGEDLYTVYRSQSLLRGIELPHWHNLHPIQRDLWSATAEDLCVTW